MERNCGNCALKAIKAGMCPIFNRKTKDEDSCPYFTTKVSTCESCGQLLTNNEFLIESNNIFHTVCQNCATSNKCGLCANSNQCAFQTDRSCSEPPMIMEQRRQGNMIVQQQVINMKRVQITCTTCPCFRSEGLSDGDFCWRQLNCSCSNHRYKF